MNTCQFHYSYFCLIFLSLFTVFLLSLVSGSENSIKDVIPGLPKLVSEEVYTWNILKDYLEYYDYNIELVRKHYPELEEHLLKSQWYSIVDVIKCEYDTNEDDVFPPRIKIKNLTKIIEEVKSLWKKKNFIFVSFNQEEFIQKCLFTIKNLIYHPKIIVQTYDSALLRSLCHDSATMFFNPAMLYEELKVKIDADGQRFPVSSLKCIDQERIRFGQWSAIVHLHALDAEDGRDRIFSLDSKKNNSLLPYLPPVFFIKGIEEEVFETVCEETLSNYYSRTEEKRIILNIFCKDAKNIYYSDPTEIVRKYNIYGEDVGKLKISEIKKKASRVNPPSLSALNLLEYRILRISQWSVIVEQLRIDQDSTPRYDRILGQLSLDPRIYDYIPSLNFEEFESNCKLALDFKMNEQKKKGIFFKGIEKNKNLNEYLEKFEEWELLYVIEVVESETFCRDAAAIYYETSRELFAVPREIPLIEPPQSMDPGKSLGKKDLPPESLDLNKERSVNRSKMIQNLEWRIQASTYLWEKLTASRVHSRLEDTITNIQWQKIKQQTDGFLFFNIGIIEFFDGIANPSKSIFSFSDDPFGMYNQCIHAFSEARRRYWFNGFELGKKSENKLDVKDSIQQQEYSKYRYKWTISKHISEELLNKGITSENLDEFPEFATAIKKTICMEAVKEYFEDPIQCPFILDEIDSIKFKIKSIFPESSFSNVTDPKLADPNGELEAQEQWKYIHDFSIKLREQELKDPNFNQNIIVITRKMPLSYLEFRNSSWRPQHECYQDMVINCIQSSWPIVEENWKVQKVKTDLASALAIFCDNVSIQYFQRKKQWRQLIKLINTSQKYSSSFEWIRRGYYLPESYKVLNIPIKHGKECKVDIDKIKKYSKDLVRSILDLIKYRYLAPFTSNINEICDSIALDMSVSTTRGIWIGLVPVDSEVLIEMERLSDNGINKDAEDIALGYHPKRDQFTPKNKFIKRDLNVSRFRFKKDKENQEAINMVALKPPIKTTVIPKIRLLQYKEIVEKDKDDISPSYPMIDNQRADWRKYLNKNFDIDDRIIGTEKNIKDFYEVDLTKFHNSPNFSNSKYRFANYISAVPKFNKRILTKRDLEKYFPSRLYKSEKLKEPSDKVFGNFIVDIYDQNSRTNRNLIKNYKKPLLFQKQKLFEEVFEDNTSIFIPEIKKPKPLTKEQIYERAKNIHLEDDELDEIINTKQITDYINKPLKKIKYSSEAISKTEFKVNDNDENKFSKNKALATSEILHSIIKSSEYYNIKANCIPHYGYYLGNTLREEDLLRGARFVYRCLRMDGHFVNPQTAYRIWLRSEFLRRKSPKFIPTGYKNYMKSYIKRRSEKDDQTYCPGENQDKLDMIADTIATAAYINNIFLSEHMPQVCIIAHEFFHNKIRTLSKCVKTFKKHIDKVNGEHLINPDHFPLICSFFESELGRNVFS